jgi:hypothetical protein
MNFNARQSLAQAFSYAPERQRVRSATFPPAPNSILGPTFGSSDSQALKAVRTSGELGWIPFMAESGIRPWLLGSGKLGTPCARMHEAKATIALAAAACSAWLRGGGPPGRYLRQACIAAWNWGEFGSAFPVTTTPPIEMELFDAFAAEPTAAWNPCAVRQDASSARLGVAELDVATPTVELLLVAGVDTLATDGAFEPPQPAASRERTASVATAAVARVHRVTRNFITKTYNSPPVTAR